MPISRRLLSGGEASFPESLNVSACACHNTVVSTELNTPVGNARLAFVLLLLRLTGDRWACCHPGGRNLPSIPFPLSQSLLRAAEGIYCHVAEPGQQIPSFH